MGLVTGATKIIETIGKHIAKYKKSYIAAGAVTYGISRFFQGNYEDVDEVSHLKFPLDDLSAGGFTTHLQIRNWKTGVVAKSDAGDLKTTEEEIISDEAFHIYLPMPLALSAGYGQKFSESENMTYNRHLSGFGGIDGVVSSNLQSMMYQVTELVNSAINPTNAGQMGGNSVINNAPGMVYDGQQLRSHTFSWRLTPKNPEEQLEINAIIRALKFSSASAMASITGSKDETPYLGGRLTIPHTVEIRFLDGEEENQHLFKTKECFITNLDINYTTTGAWTAHEDGSPMEVQITINLKEITQLTLQELQIGGY